MVIPTGNGVPIGPWHTNVKTNHWLHLTTFALDLDMSGNEYVLLLKHIRETIEAVATELHKHNIEIVNAHCAETYDWPSMRRNERVYKVSIGFGNHEDLVIAKLALKCSEYD